MTATFGARVSGGFDLNMLVLDFPRRDRCSDVDWWTTLRAFESGLTAHGAKGVIVASLPENLPEDYAPGLMARGMVPLYGITEAFDAVEAAAFIGQAWASSPLEGEVPAKRAVGVASEGTTNPSPSRGEDKTLDEAAAKSLLAEAGVSVPAGRRAAIADEAVAAANALGYPVALKALGVAHKSEAGAVKLNLRNAESVWEAAIALAPLGSGLYVERMVRGGVAELIVGFTRDPLFGPVMTLGSGGVLVELLKDSATLLLPASRAEVEGALRGLKMFPLLDGFRGRPKADLDAAIDAVLALAGFVSRNADAVEELDVNPLIVCAEGQGAWVADALMVGTLTSPLRGEVAAKSRVGVP
jgi:acyl-CoA synthetase (NDP forming)